MKAVMSVLPILILGTQVALAADPPGPPPGGPPRGGPPIERMAKELNLDETQKAQVKGILEAQRVKREARMSADDQELEQELSGVLTAEQLQKFRQKQAERRERMRDGPPPPRRRVSVTA